MIVTLQRLFAVLISAVLLFALPGCTDSAAPKFRLTDVTGASFGKLLELTDHNGQRRTLADFRGKVVTVFFGFTHCPDVCPATLGEMAMVMKELGADAGRLQVLFVTVDPARDTPDVLKRYVPAFHPSFLGLTGSADDVGNLVYSVVLCLPRIAASLIILPVLTKENVPVMVRNSLAVGLALVVYPRFRHDRYRPDRACRLPDSDSQGAGHWRGAGLSVRLDILGLEHGRRDRRYTKRCQHGQYDGSRAGPSGNSQCSVAVAVCGLAVHGERWVSDFTGRADYQLPGDSAIGLTGFLAGECRDLHRRD